MIDDQQLALRLRQALNEPIVSIEPLGVHECYSSLPLFAPFRAIYRLWSSLNEPQPAYAAAYFSQFMQRAVYFA